MRGRARLAAFVLTLCLLPLAGCGGQIVDGDGMVNSYRQVSQEEAARLMAENPDCVILDVRTREEYEEAHIPGAICVPNETIGEEDVPELSDKAQLILVYCRSGRRSKEASQKLFDLGYTNIVEFGGIQTWPGETVAGGAQ